MDEAMWVFGYGSLIWRPGFEPAERRPARLHGWHRAMCVISHVHRGTEDRPGLVCGLDRGGSCRGVAFRVRPGEEDAVRDYLRAREQVTGVYLEVHRPAHLIDLGRPVRALCFVVDRGHRQYGGNLSTDARLALVARGEGRSGRSLDYLTELVASLESLGIRDLGLRRLLDQARATAPAAA